MVKRTFSCSIGPCTCPVSRTSARANSGLLFLSDIHYAEVMNLNLNYVSLSIPTT